MSKFIETTRGVEPYEIVWLHTEKPHWIVKYDEIRSQHNIRLAFFEAYRTVEPLPKGRKPWTVDNKRFSDGHGFSTLEQAMQAAA